ncbi:hypothetical protein R1sor_025704 [Riccia sorocarpa]|uniref:Uncharacterized protein n=1 Tax=Riccia sorocarpa TaxID=122646 RepID=A0ABD3GAR2_9MARC
MLFLHELHQRRLGSRPNKEYTGPWVLHNVHPKKALEVAGFAETIGPGQGVTEQWDKDDLADLIEVGDFFAAEAELDNDYDVEFWIIQCTKTMHALENIHTDAYGSTHEKGSYVLEGICVREL